MYSGSVALYLWPLYLCSVSVALYLWPLYLYSGSVALYLWPLYLCSVSVALYLWPLYLCPCIVGLCLRFLLAFGGTCCAMVSVSRQAEASKGRAVSAGTRSRWRPFSR